MMPGETAFTRMPLVAYSIASALVAELMPPLVRFASAVGTAEVAWSVRLVVMLTIWPEPCFSISVAARWVMWKKPATLVAILVLKSSCRVLGERLADEDAGIVDQACPRGRSARIAVPTASSAVAGSAMSPATATTSASLVGLMLRDVATTR